MRFGLSVLALAFLLFCCPPSAQAGFWVKKQEPVSTVAAGTSTLTSPSVVNPAELLKRIVARPIERPEDHHRDNSGWQGIVSLGCGVVGIVGLLIFFPADLAIIFSMLAYPAIIFGIIGTRHHRKHRGMAIAGIILGAVVTLLWATFFVIVFGALFGVI
jgi:Na+/proline symporter